MLKNQTKTYLSLNELAKPNGTVIFGGKSDIDIPLCELKQAFSLDSNLYNRSFPDLSVTNAIEYYDIYVAELHPESIFLHIGETDIDDFIFSPANYDKKYGELIRQIKSKNQKCHIIIVSLKNHDNNSDISEMNKHLK